MMPTMARRKETEGVTSIGLIERMKNQGVALQRRALEREDILPLYGSSELLKPVPEKASLFFSSYPSGFAVFPVGKPGTTSLIMLQKIASIGPQVRGRRVALSLSSTWFFKGGGHQYEGNFSRQQALAALLNPRLSFSFRQELARALLNYPRTLEHEPLLTFLLRHLAGGSWSDHWLWGVAQPLAQWQSLIDAAQDHFEVLFYASVHARRLGHKPPQLLQPLDWAQLIAQASARPNLKPHAAAPGPGLLNEAADRDFRHQLEQGEEWTHLELLVRGLHELGLRPLFLCAPPNGPFLESLGIRRGSLALYAAKLRLVAGRYGGVVETFEDHQQDTNFLGDGNDHLGPRGWMFYNQALDRFYHTPANGG